MSQSTTSNTKLARQLATVAIVLGMSLQVQARFDVDIFMRTVITTIASSGGGGDGFASGNSGMEYFARSSADEWKEANRDPDDRGVSSPVALEAFGDSSRCENGRHFDWVQCNKYRYAKLSFDVPYHDGVRVDAYAAEDNRWNVFFTGGDGTQVGHCEEAHKWCSNAFLQAIGGQWCGRLMWCQIDALD